MIAVDLGFGYTKAVSENGKVIFPAVQSPSYDNRIDEFDSIGHYMVMKRPGDMRTINVNIGERAIKEGRITQMSLDREKHSAKNDIVMALAAAYLCGQEGPTDLAIGLPITSYKDKNYRKKVVEMFEKCSYYVKVDDGKETHISFNNVICFPQGVGAVYSLEALPDDGLVGLLDVGFFTTDLVLFEIDNGKIKPLNEYFRSVDIGISRAFQLFADNFTNITGRPVNLVKAMELWNKDHVTYRGNRVDIRPMIEEAKNNAGESIKDAVKEAWSEKIDWLDYVIMCGGGAEEVAGNLREMVPQAVVLNEPQFANTLGFYRMMELAGEKGIKAG